MNLINYEKTDGFTSTIAMENINNLFEDDSRMKRMIDKFNGHYFNEIRYHVMEHYGMATFMLYCNNAPSNDVFEGTTLHAIFCVDTDYDQLAKMMVEGTYKRFIKAVHESVKGNMNPIFSIGTNTFGETLSNDEENESVNDSFGHQHPLLDVIENIWNKEEEDNMREEGKII